MLISIRKTCIQLSPFPKMALCLHTLTLTKLAIKWNLPGCKALVSWIHIQPILTMHFLLFLLWLFLPFPFFVKSMVHFMLAQSMRADTGITQPTRRQWRLFSKLSLGINTESKCSKLHKFTKFKPWAPKPLFWLINPIYRMGMALVLSFLPLQTGCFHPVYLGKTQP